MDWRILTAITVLSWGVYNIILKAVSGRIAWQISMLWFVFGYMLMVAAFCAVNFSGGKFKLFPSIALWPLVSGIMCGVGAITFFKAIPLVSGSVLMPLVGLFVLISAVGCLIFLHEPLTWRVVLGIGCATAAVMLLGK